MRKIKKKTIERYKSIAQYIRSERRTGRHIVACLGSAGLTFVEDIAMFCNWCDENGYKDISQDYKNCL